MYTISILHANKIAEYHQAFNEELKVLRSLLRRTFDPLGIMVFPIRSLTPQQATGNALAAGFISCL